MEQENEPTRTVTVKLSQEVWLQARQRAQRFRWSLPDYLKTLLQKDLEAQV